MTTTSGGSGGVAAPPDQELPPAVDDEVLEQERRRWTPARIAVWAAIALLGGLGWVMIAVIRGETVNAVWFVFAVGLHATSSRSASTASWIERKITPPRRHAVPPRPSTRRTVRTTCRPIDGSCSGTTSPPSPAPVRWSVRCWPRRWGYLPGTIWIIVGVSWPGAVQDYLVLFFSMRRGGRSLGQMARDELGRIGGTAADRDVRSS